MCVGVWRAGREGLGEHEHNFRQAHESWVLRLGNSQLVLVGGGRIAEEDLHRGDEGGQPLSGREPLSGQMAGSGAPLVGAWGSDAQSRSRVRMGRVACVEKSEGELPDAGAHE